MESRVPRDGRKGDESFAEVGSQIWSYLSFQSVEWLILKLDGVPLRQGKNNLIRFINVEVMTDPRLFKLGVYLYKQEKNTGYSNALFTSQKTRLARDLHFLSSVYFSLRYTYYEAIKWNVKHFVFQHCFSLCYNVQFAFSFMFRFMICLIGTSLKRFEIDGGRSAEVYPQRSGIRSGKQVRISPTFAALIWHLRCFKLDDRKYKTELYWKKLNSPFFF